MCLLYQALQNGNIPQSVNENGLGLGERGDTLQGNTNG